VTRKPRGFLSVLFPGCFAHAWFSFCRRNINTVSFCLILLLFKIVLCKRPLYCLLFHCSCDNSFRLSSSTNILHSGFYFLYSYRYVFNNVDFITYCEGIQNLITTLRNSNELREQSTCHVQYSSPLYPTSSQTNPAHILTLYLTSILML
jgi:hypothetical protein